MKSLSIVLIFVYQDMFFSKIIPSELWNMVDVNEAAPQMKAYRWTVGVDQEVEQRNLCSTVEPSSMCLLIQNFIPIICQTLYHIWLRGNCNLHLENSHLQMGRLQTGHFETPCFHCFELQRLD